MDYIGNVNRFISVVGYWIFDPRYEKSLVLHRESLDMICAPYVGEEQVAMFEKVLYAVRYIHKIAQLKVIFYIHKLNNRIIHYITIMRMNIDT